MNLNSILADCKESYDLCNKVIYPVYRKMLKEKTIPQRFSGWGPFVTMFPNDAITFGKYRHIFPYDSERAFHESLSIAAQNGYLTFDGIAYRATEKGEETNRKEMQVVTDIVAPLEPMPQAELKRLVDYLIRLCESTTAAPEPPSHFCQAHYQNYKRTFPSNAPLMQQFVHYYKEQDFYRTDAHVAAWQIHKIAGNCWEAFTVVWSGEADTLDKFFEEHSDRGFTRDEYAQAFQELVDRGWLEENAGVFRLTDEGKRIRDDAEALTDKYFFAPWGCLSESELEELSSLASQLRDKLKGL